MGEMLCTNCAHQKVCSFKEKLADLYFVVANVEKETIFSVEVNCKAYRKDVGNVRGER